MLIESSVTFITFAVYILATVKSQEQLFNPTFLSSFQTAPFPGFGSQSSPLKSSSYPLRSLSSPKFPAKSNVQEPPKIHHSDVEFFAEFMSRLLQASDVLKEFSIFAIYAPYNYFFNLGGINLDKVGKNDLEGLDNLADLAGDAGKVVALVTSQLYFDIMGLIFAKFFAAGGQMTPEVALTYPQYILNFVEDYAKQNGLVDTKSLFSAVSGGFYSFAVSRGLDTPENIAMVIKILVQEIQALASGAKF